MHTRSGLKLPNAPPPPPARRATRTVEFRRKLAVDFFDGLPDDVVLIAFSKLAAAAAAPADLINLALTCRRFNRLANHPSVLSKTSSKGLRFKANAWSEPAHKFLSRCAYAGNLDACYLLGMIHFYCLENRKTGASMMAKAAMKSHPAALYSLAVINFNGSGGSKHDKNLLAGAALCARAAHFGHIDALRELGHCLQDGYGVKRSVEEGRRFLLQANARELALALMKGKKQGAFLPFAASSLLSDFGCDVEIGDGEAVNLFMAEWFEGRVGREEGLRMCSHGRCGRPETRKCEFRRCSVCGVVNYCSRACQAMDWKMAHKWDCVPMERWIEGGEGMGDLEGR